MAGEAPEAGRLAPFLPREPDADSLLDGFLAYTAEIGLELYPAQEDAILEIFGGSHVIITTPTGSGKSLVGLAAHFEAVARGQAQLTNGAGQGTRYGRSSCGALHRN